MQPFGSLGSLGKAQQNIPVSGAGDRVAGSSLEVWQQGCEVWLTVSLGILAGILPKGWSRRDKKPFPA